MKTLKFAQQTPKPHEIDVINYNLRSFIFLFSE